MIATGKLKDLTLNLDGTQNVTITVNTDFREEYDTLAEKPIKVEIKKFNPARSINANDYFWNLCGEIAKKSSKYSKDGKNDVYREAIRAKGEYEPLVIREDALPRFVSRWGDKGVGWFVDVIDDYKDQYKVVHAYYGSSTYDSLSMSRIIDYVVMTANDLGISTMTEKEKDKMLSDWQKKKAKKEPA